MQNIILIPLQAIIIGFKVNEFQIFMQFICKVFNVKSHWTWEITMHAEKHTHIILS